MANRILSCLFHNAHQTVTRHKSEPRRMTKHESIKKKIISRAKMWPKHQWSMQLLLVYWRSQLWTCPGEKPRVGAHSECSCHASNMTVPPPFCGLQKVSPISVFFSSIWENVKPHRNAPLLLYIYAIQLQLVRSFWRFKEPQVRANTTKNAHW